MDSYAHAPFAKYMDLMMDAVCVVDVEGRFLFVSAAGERIFGYRPDELVGLRVADLVHPDDRDSTLAGAAEVTAGRPSSTIRNRYVRKDGGVVHIMWSARWSEADQVRIGVARDVTDLHHAESRQAAVYAIAEAAHTAEDLTALFRSIHGTIGGLLPAKSFYVALHDAETGMVSFPYFVDEHDEPPAPHDLEADSLTADVIRGGETVRLAPAPAGGPGLGTDALAWLGVPLKALSGTIGALVVQIYSGSVLYTASDQALLEYVSVQVASAITRKQAETRLRRLSLYDPLTDLPNRELLHDRVRSALIRARRDRTHAAVLYIDLDGFKAINDTHGHAVGDRLLVEVAGRLVGCLRAGDTVGRLGGDEFVVLLAHIGLPEDTTMVAEKVRQVLSEPFELGDLRFDLSASIGVAVHPEDGDGLEDLLQRADEAMYRAKRAGGDRFALSAAAPHESGGSA